MKDKHRKKHNKRSHRRHHEPHASSSEDQHELSEMMQNANFSDLLGPLYVTLFNDTLEELGNCHLLQSSVEDPDAEFDTTVTADEFMAAYKTHREKKNDDTPLSDIRHWDGFSLELAEGAVTLTIVVPSGEDAPDDSNYARVVQLLASLVSPMFHPGQASAPPLGMASSSSSSGGALGIDGDELKNMLPPSLAKSPLFMNIVDMVSSELSQSGVLKELEQSFLEKKAQEAEAEAELPEDPDLPPMPESVAKVIAEETAKRKGGKMITPELVMKFAESAMGGGGGGIGEDGIPGIPGLPGVNGGLMDKLKGMAQKLSEQVRDQVVVAGASPDDIKRDFTSAIEFITNMGMPGGMDLSKIIKPEPLD